jgi:hypothetical protein
MAWIRKLVPVMKQLNMFKTLKHKKLDDVKQQRIITRTYLTFLAGMISFPL